MRAQHLKYWEGDYQAYFLFDLFFHIGFILKLSNRFFFAQLRFDWSQKCGFANMLIGHFASELLWQKTQNFGSFLSTCFISGLGFDSRKETKEPFLFRWMTEKLLSNLKQSKTFHARAHQCDVKAWNKNLNRGVL